LKNEALDDEATLKISAIPFVPRTLKLMVDDVALIPAITPLSRNVEVPIVVGDSQRVTNPKAPPESDALSPRDDVAIQRVEVPVDIRSDPPAPMLLVES
jgi:hypothetical protein